jgi:hypothetical protein
MAPKPVRFKAQAKLWLLETAVYSNFQQSTFITGSPLPKNFR